VIAKKRKTKAARKNARFRRLLRAVVAIVGFAALLVISWLALTWPDVAALASRRPEKTAFIDRARAEHDRIQWVWVDADSISRHLKKAVVVAEDMSFFSHRGFDTHEIKVAARDAVRGKRVRGASTITQQLAKNLWLSPSRSPVRKMKEVVLTRQLERRLSKKRILEIYLNVVQFGPRIYGAEAAAQNYFGVSAAELEPEQAAELAAGLPRPSSWHPGVESRGYRRSVARIRARMEQADWMDELL
jgi:monofunctional biosynthetic peptidoglycan transglycosylase